jgi:hypothetical protein
MMFDTPMPPTSSAKAPITPRKARKTPKKTRKNFSASVVSHMPMASLSLGSNFRRRASTSYTLRVAPSTWASCWTWKMKLST